MKNIRHIVLLLVTVLLLASCGTEEPGFTVGTSDESSVGDQVVQYNLGEEGTSMDAEPYDYMANDLTSFIQLGEYRNLEVTRESAFLTDEEFEDEIDNLLESYSYYAEETGRAVEEGDRVLVDYAGYLDGVAFEGGTATGQTVVAAANTGYIEGFAEAFIGQMPGEEFSFNVTFPESYDNADLAGREVTFVCTVHSIQGTEEIVPELTDAFVSETFGYNNVEEFRIIYRDTVERQKAYYVESNMYSELWTAVVDNAEVLAYPEEEVERIYEEYRSMYESYAGYYGVDYDTFLSSYMNMSDELLYEESRNYVKEDLVMYQLVKELGLQLTEEDYADGMEFFADYYGTSAEDLISYYGEETIRTTILWQALMEQIAEYAIITEG